MEKITLTERQQITIENLKFIDIQIDGVNVKYPCLCSSVPHKIIIDPSVLSKMKRTIKKLLKQYE